MATSSPGWLWASGSSCSRSVRCGWIAGLLLALAAHLMLLALPGAPWAVRVTLGWVRLISAAVGVGTLLPIANGPFVNDGLRFLRLLGRGPLAAKAPAELRESCERESAASAAARGAFSPDTRG